MPVLLSEPVVVHQEKGRTVVANGLVELSIDTQTGRYGMSWGTSASLSNAWGEARLADGRIRKTTDYPRHEIGRRDIRKVEDAFGSGIEVTFRHRSPGEPEMRQVFWVYENRAEAIVRFEIAAPKGTAANYLAPLVTNDLRVRHANPLQSLFVPYDNNMYFRYRSDGWGEGEGDGDGSYEVGAVYNDGNRHGLVVGSIDHDSWKSAVSFKRDSKGELESLRAYAGVTSKYTHDKEPHGTVAGTVVRSPRMLVGRYEDWRAGLERYGDLNALVKPPLAWKAGVPFGWNSWSGHKTKLKAAHAEAATNFLRTDLPKFRNDGTAYVNLDSFWDNLSVDERQAFVDRAHAAGLKAGIYFTPFTAWGNLTDKVQGTSYIYRDLALKDAKGEPLPRLSGGWPLDPTHPGVIARNERQMAEFVKMGFDFVKLDFLSHGALEGQHADHKVTTGTAAYAFGMRKIAESLSPEKIGRPFFVSLSIAPLFPQGYAHSRRVSCDVFANIGATEYLLNSVNYGWWAHGRLYRFNDGDSSCVYQPMDEPPVTEAESRSRFTASLISGGMMIEGDDLTDPKARERVSQIFTRQEILALAKKAHAFRPVYGDTATEGGRCFIYVEPDGKTAYLALFNFDKTREATATTPLSRLGLDRQHRWSVRDLWKDARLAIEGDGVTVRIPPMDCALLELKR